MKSMLALMVICVAATPGIVASQTLEIMDAKFPMVVRVFVPGEKTPRQQMTASGALPKSESNILHFFPAGIEGRPYRIACTFQQGEQALSPVLAQAGVTEVKPSEVIRVRQIGIVPVNLSALATHRGGEVLVALRKPSESETELPSDDHRNPIKLLADKDMVDTARGLAAFAKQNITKADKGHIRWGCFDVFFQIGKDGSILAEQQAGSEAELRSALEMAILRVMETRMKCGHTIQEEVDIVRAQKNGMKTPTPPEEQHEVF